MILYDEYLYFLQWAIGTCTFWLMLAKMGTYLNFLTFLSFICNGAFLLVPLLKFFPEFEVYVTTAKGTFLFVSQNCKAEYNFGLCILPESTL